MEMQAAQLQGACQGYGGCHFPVFSSPTLPPLHSTPIVISHQLSNLQPSILLEYMQPPEPWKEREIYLLSLLVQSSDFHFHVQLLYRSVWAQKRTLTWSEHKRDVSAQRSLTAPSFRQIYTTTLNLNHDNSNSHPLPCATSKD